MIYIVLLAENFKIPNRITLYPAGCLGQSANAWKGEGIELFLENPRMPVIRRIRNINHPLSCHVTWAINLNPYQLKIVMILVAMQHAGKEITSFSHLCELTCLSPKTVRSNFKKLEYLGVVKKVLNFSEDGGNSASSYEIDMECVV